MSRLPPADKLPLALRKNVRDKWEEKKPDFEKKISDALGTAWTIDINPLVLFPYATSSYGKENLGQLIQSYANSGWAQLQGFARQYGADGLADLNTAASEHVISMDVDDSATPVKYCGCTIRNGQLVILFNPTQLGVADSEALSAASVLKALNEVPQAEGAAPELSFSAKSSVRQKYEPKIANVQAKIAEQLGKPADAITLVPNFEALYAALLAESKRPGNKLYKKWEDQIGPFVLGYFESVQSHLTQKKFATDDMLQEGFNEAVDKSTIELRLVDKLKYAKYCEVVVEDGKLYVQTTLEQYGNAIVDAASKIVDQL
ncbi:hypothetical protein SCUCBS95973_004036 [Sporothrix curviconia]|uniref:Uncharacterized protein n=1 Tax=Sporothrix curviconia TaxID=1260050 RepID=A0ABP0BKP2_9PEZI